MDKCRTSKRCCLSNPIVDVTIDFLFLDLSECEWCQGTEQNLKTAIEKLSDILELTGISLQFNKIHILSEQHAEELNFMTSPTIRVNGKDIQLNYKESQCASCSDLCGEDVQCRVWLYRGKEYTAPPVGMIIEAVLREIFGSDDNKNHHAIAKRAPQNLKKFFQGMSSKRNQR